ncbi:glycoside hydrolase family 28 protein [Cellvibrio sp. NN19]|uniref:glycoside hydrolase family 28 protein n=1 Tax=Cellvibrio chitinivorans TaxID=3102792 RepID=UPI002B403D67|nr:glycoside hydrolase family 28 protein [Cellvibrio sp. NN19]
MQLSVLSFAQVNSKFYKQSDWKQMDVILKKVESPKIPDKSFVITDFGAKANSTDDSRPAIMSAINAAVKAGGGRVVIPAGKWISNGPIHLQSFIDLHVSEGATLLFGAAAKDYLPAVFTRWEGTEIYGYSPLIYANKVTDVAITGTGTIDGNAQSEFHAWHKQQAGDIASLRKMGFDGVPLEKRQFGEGHFLRPPLIQIVNAERVLLQGYTATNSPFWVNHLVYVDHAQMRNVNVDSMLPNNDGIDVDSGRWVVIEDNHFRTGDDSIVIKSGRDLDGRKIGRPSENVVVRNNILDGEDGIGLGSEMSGGIKNVFFTDNTYIKGTSVFRLKANLDRGGSVEHVRIRNTKIGEAKYLFWFDLSYVAGYLGGNFPSKYHDIVFENIVAEKIDTFFISHAPEEQPLENVLFKNIQVKSAKQFMEFTSLKNVIFTDVTINDQKVAVQFD